MISRLKSELGINMKKRLDKNHVVKNIGIQLYCLYNDKSVQISKTVINHLQKCLKYSPRIKRGIEDNMKALIPQQFGDHTTCKPEFCGFLRNPSVKYLHRSLPYQCAFKDENLRHRLEEIFQPIIARAELYAELGSSQQYEHANKEVTLRAP